MTWQPIETAPISAPTEYKEILLTNGVRIWIGIKESDDTYAEGAVIYGITHWMPLPEPPK